MPLPAPLTRAVTPPSGRRRALLISALAAATLAGCQAAPPSGAINDDILAFAPPITQGLDARGLSTLLTAELAGQRGRYREAAEGYLDAAERYGDPALAQRATFAARFGESLALLQTAASRWQALDPSTTTPGRLLSALAAEQGDWEGALNQRLALAEQGEDAGLAALAEQALAAGAPISPLLARLNQALAKDRLPDAGRGDAHLAAALLAHDQNNAAAADRHLDQAQKLMEEAPALWRTRAQIALENGSNGAARRAAREGLERFPDDPRFALLLAQAEIRLGNTSAAEAQTNALMERHQGGPELRLAIARLYLEEDAPEAAKRLLHPLASRDDLTATGYYLLGLADEQTGSPDSALLYYRQVEGDETFLPARVAAARMLVEAGRMQDARAFLKAERERFPERFNALLLLEAELLDEQGLNARADALLERGLDHTPDASGLLYQRAMRAWRADDLNAMERDLQRVLEREPDNVMALNALGYTLADEQVPGRLDDARRLVERAHELEPDNAAVQDSLGWVYFRQGQPEKALPLLEQAYRAMPDQEVAAHLAEVLHTLGQGERARRIVARALATSERHPAIDGLLERHPELAP